MANSDLSAFDIEVFYDGGCPLCSREVDWLRRRDRQHRLKFTDIDSTSFDAAAYGKTRDELMAKMHARLPDGAWLIGVEAFRGIYLAIGYRWLVAFSRWPVVSHCLDAGYSIFAKRRLQLTGRCQSGSPCRVESR